MPEPETAWYSAAWRERHKGITGNSGASRVWKGEQDDKSRYSGRLLSRRPFLLPETGRPDRKGDETRERYIVICRHSSLENAFLFVRFRKQEEK